MRRRAAVWIIAVLTIISGTPATAAHAASAGAATSAGHLMSSRYLLNHLQVQGGHYEAYLRSKFELWTAHANGCDTRDLVLIRDAVRKPTVGPGCYLTNGKWRSPYDGLVTTNPTKIQIDHVVPLAVAWGSGAYRWNADTRKRFANDLGTRYDLLAVSAHTNEAKGDSGPDQWRPPLGGFDCRYMTDYTGVLWRWQLTIDRTEKNFLASHLGRCGWPRIYEPPRPPIGYASTGGGSGTTGGSAHACTRTSTGKCIKAGEFCPAADYGRTGYDGSGVKLICTGTKSHPHWTHV